MKKRHPNEQGYPSFFVVDSLSAINEYSRFRPQAIKKIYCLEKYRASFSGLVPLDKIKIFQKEPQKKDSDEEKSFWAEINLSTIQEDCFIKRIATRQNKDLIIALDHISDPRNLGAIVRSAAFFGIKEVIAPTRRQVLLTNASVATAQGGFALTDLVEVTNLARTLTKLKEMGYWIVGTGLEGENYLEILKFYEKIVVVLGAEDRGLSQGIMKICDRVVSIQGKTPGLDSLNVSVAAGIIMQGFFSKG